VSQGSAGYRGQVTDIMIYAKEFELTKRRLNEIYVKHTGRDFKSVEEALERDNYMGPEEAKSFGLIDKILTKRDDMEGLMAGLKQ
jgi:ATP-dependent Clp protease, protease subunit